MLGGLGVRCKVAAEVVVSSFVGCRGFLECLSGGAGASRGLMVLLSRFDGGGIPRGLRVGQTWNVPSLPAGILVGHVGVTMVSLLDLVGHAVVVMKFLP